MVDYTPFFFICPPELVTSCHKIGNCTSKSRLSDNLTLWLIFFNLRLIFAELPFLSISFEFIQLKNYKGYEVRCN